MMARSGEPAEKVADTRTAPQTQASKDTEPLVNRFPAVAFSYDVDASRLVMQYRDPANGKTVSQIPTEAALKQYKEAQQQEKAADRASALEATLGGADGKAAGKDAAVRGGAAFSPAKTSAHAPASAPTTAQAPSSGGAHVAHSAPSTTHPAAASTGVARVNVVI